MMDKQLLGLYGLKWNPFLPALPADALWPLPGAEPFARRLEGLVAHGGFALVTGDPGHGKSKTLQWLEGRLTRLPDVTVGVMEQPQNRLGDFYRELGVLFGVPPSRPRIAMAASRRSGPAGGPTARRRSSVRSS